MEVDEHYHHPATSYLNDLHFISKTFSLMSPHQPYSAQLHSHSTYTSSSVLVAEVKPTVTKCACATCFCVS